MQVVLSLLSLLHTCPAPSAAAAHASLPYNRVRQLPPSHLRQQQVQGVSRLCVYPCTKTVCITVNLDATHMCIVGSSHQL
jgi:hypothetical protein